MYIFVRIDARELPVIRFGASVHGGVDSSSSHGQRLIIPLTMFAGYLKSDSCTLPIPTWEKGEEKILFEPTLLGVHIVLYFSQLTIGFLRRCSHLGL